MTGRMKIGSLFAGVGGLELGLERAGVGHTVWQVEREPFCRQVLAKHWPDAIRYEDVTTVEWSEVEPVEVLCGGFPCQDVAPVGRRAGLDGEHSGLWAEFARAVRHLRPRYVVVENSTGLLVRGMGRVVGDLAASGYSVEWDCIPATAVGSPQLRTRLWLVAYSGRVGDGEDDTVRAGWPELVVRPGWVPEPDVDRVADGVPSRMDRAQVHALGNAVVPAVAEVVGRRLLELERAS